jgi:hypothetical protein
MKRFVLVLGGIVCVLSLGTCTTITEDMPERPTSNDALSPPILVVPAPPPGAPAPPNPAPTHAPPGPAPAPPEAPPPSQGHCSLPPGSEDNARCAKESPSFLGEVNEAIDRLVRQRPDIFDVNDNKGGGSYKVERVDLYLAGVVSNLESVGFCAYWNGEELQVKNSNAFDDAFDILTADNHVRRSYMGTCHPASF